MAQSLDHCLTRRAAPGRALLTATIVVALVALLCAGCEIQKPALPTFTTTLNVPLEEQRIEMADLVEDESFLSVGQDGCLAFSLEGEPDTLIVTSTWKPASRPIPCGRRSVNSIWRWASP